MPGDSTEEPRHLDGSPRLDGAHIIGRIEGDDPEQVRREYEMIVQTREAMRNE